MIDLLEGISMKVKEPTRYWTIHFGWYRLEKYRFKRPMKRDEVEGLMDSSARRDREYRYGAMTIEPVSKNRFYAI